MDPGAVHRMRRHAAFPLSDHAGYDDLLRHVDNVAPRRASTLHGYASEFAADLRLRGIEAWAPSRPEPTRPRSRSSRPRAPARPAPRFLCRLGVFTISARSARKSPRSLANMRRSKSFAGDFENWTNPTCAMPRCGSPASLFLSAIPPRTKQDGPSFERRSSRPLGCPRRSSAPWPVASMTAASQRRQR
jgi:hypothetical protein